MNGLVAALRKSGFNAIKPKGSFFLYVKAPKAVAPANGQRLAFQNAEEVSQWLITEKLLSTVPWDDAGANLRFSVTFIARDEADERRVLSEIESRLSDVRFEFD
jgi:LL-diaminopimelate aminotransferase